MALVLLPSATVTFSFVDETGSKGRLALSAPSDTAFTAIEADADDMSPLIAAMTGCAVLGYAVTYKKKETLVVLGNEDSRIERKGKFVWLAEDGTTSETNVPGILGSVVSREGRIDEDATSVAAFVSAVVGGVWSNSHGADLSILSEAYESFKATTKGLAPRARKPDVNTTPGD